MVSLFLLAMLTPDFKLNHTLWWGKMYRQAEALPQWKMPTDANVAMALDIVGIADEAVTTLNGLLDSRTGDHVWINDFCRAMSLVDEVIIGSYALIQEAPDKKLSDVKASDVAPQ